MYNPQFYQKTKLSLDLSDEALKIMIYLQENLHGESFFLVNLYLSKANSTKEIFQYGFSKLAFFQISKIFYEMPLSFLF